MNLSQSVQQVALNNYSPLFLMAAIVVITIPTTIITNTNNISQFALQLNFIALFLLFKLALSEKN